MDRGEGQQWSKAPGNLYSTPREIAFDPANGETIRLELDKVIPPIPDPPTTKYVKHEKIRSERLSKFWGRRLYLGRPRPASRGLRRAPQRPLPARHQPRALPGHDRRLPRGAARSEPEARLLRPLPPRGLQPDPAGVRLSALQGLDCARTIPRYLVIEIQHANPYYDDSYAVNSQNVGPYGDAITYELIPYLEKKYRAIGAGWARFMYGGSTGGWESLGAQIFYPDEYNGAWAACPDPIDFHAYARRQHLRGRERVLLEGPVEGRADARPPRLPRPHLLDRRADEPARARARPQHPLGRAVRHLAGRLLAGRAATATRSPSGTSAPASSTRPSRRTGRRTTTSSTSCGATGTRASGKKLEGKIHIYVGEMDNYYLNNAVYLAEDFLEEHEGSLLRRRDRLRARAPSTAGTATTRGPTTSRACATTRCSLRRSSSGSRRARPRART